MLLSADISEKSFGNKVLYHDLNLEIQENEKVGLIGRNGTGKSSQTKQLKRLTEFHDRFLRLTPWSSKTNRQP